jgi:hypothetical protein
MAILNDKCKVVVLFQNREGFVPLQFDTAEQADEAYEIISMAMADGDDRRVASSQFSITINGRHVQLVSRV